jgi:hypothetical protein
MEQVPLVVPKHRGKPPSDAGPEVVVPPANQLVL